MSEASAFQGVDVAQIERQLRLVWEQLAESPPDESQQAVMRACVLNLLICCRSVWEPSRMSETMAEITREHPSRILAIFLDSSQVEQGVQAEVTAECHRLSGGRRHVCCEIIRLQAAAGDEAELPSIVRPLLVPDLPVALWWRDAPDLEDRLFKELVSASDRVVIDSAKLGSPMEELLQLSRLVEERRRWTAFSDLNWSRLTPWRTSIAGMFDVPIWRTALQQISRVEIGYAGSAADELPVQVLLAAGWFCSRLGWRLSSSLKRGKEAEYAFECGTGERSVSFEIRLEAEVEAGAGPVCFRMLTADEPESVFEVRADTGCRHLESSGRAGGKATGHVVCRLQEYNEGELMCRELEILGRDQPYEQALDFAARLLEG